MELLTFRPYRIVSHCYTITKHSTVCDEQVLMLNGVAALPIEIVVDEFSVFQHLGGTAKCQSPSLPIVLESTV